MRTDVRVENEPTQRNICKCEACSEERERRGQKAQEQTFGTIDGNDVIFASTNTQDPDAVAGGDLACDAGIMTEIISG